ncbi:MAG: hypothetical protein IJG80_05905, partial [Selenomonadaceae bacterium]|nr:hypothetical protein [Selenomonadaceae bacterium]
MARDFFLCGRRKIFQRGEVCMVDGKFSARRGLHGRRKIFSAAKSARSTEIFQRGEVCTVDEKFFSAAKSARSTK